MAGLWQGAGCDSSCGLCWGMKGKKAFQSSREAALYHTRCGYNPQDSTRFLQGERAGASI